MATKMYRVDLIGPKTWRSSGIVFRKGRPHYMNEDQVERFRSDGYFRVTEVETPDKELDKANKGVIEGRPALKPKLRMNLKKDTKDHVKLSAKSEEK